MAEFSGKILDAYYFDEDYTTIEVIYKNENDENISYVLEADPNHPDFQDLEADGWTTEKLAEATVEYKRQQANAFSEAINVQVQERLKEVINTSFKDKEKKLKEMEKELRAERKVLDDQIYDTIFSNNTDKEYLFKFKLWAMEQPAIKNAPKFVKSDLRKSKTILEGLSILQHALIEKGE